ncbi:hypothetical protein, partial [Carnimonas bestiolae]|uniref:hypothetical protein n=1 Tax=Carnimonas bestiolae TaxID=3402172 RepID=UPI003F4AB91A
GGWRLAVGGWRLAVGGWRLAVGGWRLAVGGWRLAVGERIKTSINTSAGMKLHSGSCATDCLAAQGLPVLTNKNPAA